MADPIFVHEAEGAPRAARASAFPAAPRGPALHAIVPHSLEEAYRLAKAVVLARLAPKGLETPEACLVAILHGLEVGLKPMHALQSLALIQGRPVLWGDGALALVRASGLLRAIEETHGRDAEAGLMACCRVQRKGERKAVLRTFSQADAVCAGLWGKAGPWTLYPQRMLQMRARSFALRDVFPDVLGGLAVREDMEDVAWPGPNGANFGADFGAGFGAGAGADAGSVEGASSSDLDGTPHDGATHGVPFDWEAWQLRVMAARSPEAYAAALQDFDEASASFTARDDILRAQALRARGLAAMAAAGAATEPGSAEAGA
jgi:hypothetical protein